MRDVVRTPRFNRSYVKYVRKYPMYKENVHKALVQIAEDPYNSSLGTHKLKGKLSSFFSCSCGFDCRIIFQIKRMKENEIIVLHDIGLHQDLY